MAAPVDVRADLFAFGALLYEYAIGIAPVRSDVRAGRRRADPAANRRRSLTSAPTFRAARRRHRRAACRRARINALHRRATRFAGLASDDVAHVGPGSVVWWRNHMASVVLLVLRGCRRSLAGQGVEPRTCRRGLRLRRDACHRWSVLRGHLLFAGGRMNGVDLLQELHRTSGSARGRGPRLLERTRARGLQVTRPPAGRRRLIALALVSACARTPRARTARRRVQRSVP